MPLHISPEKCVQQKSCKASEIPEKSVMQKSLKSCKESATCKTSAGLTLQCKKVGATECEFGEKTCNNDEVRWYSFYFKKRVLGIVGM